MRFLGLILAGCLVLVCACGELRPVPEFEAQAYKAIDYQDLLDPAKAGLQAGDLVRVKAYFWQYLTYDPAMVRNYLTLPRYPVRWFNLRWFATYGSERMDGLLRSGGPEPGAGGEVQGDQAPGPHPDLRRTLPSEARGLPPGPPYRED